MELCADEISLDPSSNMRRFVIKPGGNEPGPEGDGKCRPMTCEPPPIPGEGALRGGVARPKPESVSAFNSPASTNTPTAINQSSSGIIRQLNSNGEGPSGLN